ncbi:MAG: DNA repair protein RecO [Anaerolineales bacterium]|jgi:DNA repair protein RecO (recombination protein O)
MPPRERSLRVEGIVLGYSDFGEADRLLSLYTRQLGKVKAIAKGVRKPHSRKAGHVEPFTRSSMQLARGRDLFILTQAETVEAHLPLREDLVILGYAAYVVELLDRFSYEEGENRSLYHLLADTLARLSQGEAPQRVVRYYEFRLLDLVGFRPELKNCTQCKEEIKPQDQFFSPAQGGVLCPGCGGGEAEARPVSRRALKYMRFLQRSSYAEVRRSRFAPAVQREVEDLMQHYLTYLLERGLNSPAFIRRMRRERRRKVRSSSA